MAAAKAVNASTWQTVRGNEVDRLTLRRMLLIWGAILMVACSSRAQAGGADGRRFFYEGDGRIHLASKKNPHHFNGVYRQAGQYDETAYKAICQVFTAPYNPQRTGLSLRLIAFLDYLQDRLSPGSRIIITSGYRDPVYNTKLRQGGRLAAKASLHQYGMAADIVMEGIPSERIWQYVKDLGFGGTGYYHGETVHLDVGPARWWDETTSGVGTGLADDNKLIGLVTDFDRYTPNDRVTLGFIRMTAFPIGVVPEFVLKRTDGSAVSAEVLRFKPQLGLTVSDRCPQLGSIAQMAAIQWRLPLQLPPGKYRVEALFCETFLEKMPRQVITPVFEVIRP